MNKPIFYTGADVAQLLGWPMVYAEPPDETARVSRVGIVVVGASLKEAAAARLTDSIRSAAAAE